MLPKISIVIPSYNKAKYIGATLKSIFNQNYQNLEVIIQDGGSTDGTVDIIKEFAKKHKIIWVSKKDKGQLDAINKGLKKTTGDILTYLNADDVYNPLALNKVVAGFGAHPKALWLVGAGNVIDDGGKVISKLTTSYKNFLLSINKYPFLLMVNYLTQPSVFLTKKSYKEYGPFVGRKEYVLEYDFWLKLGRVEMPQVLPNLISSFRISGTNISAVSYQSLLADDYNIVKKYTTNKFILFVHKLNNWGRVLIINLLK